MDVRPVSLDKDARMLTGKGVYLDDLQPESTLHMRLVRSPYAHAALSRVTYPPPPKGAWVYTASDLGHHATQIPPRFKPEGYRVPCTPILAGDRVRYSGEPIAAVLAGDKYQAEDIAETVHGEYEELPIFLDPLKVPTVSELLHDECPGNVYFQRNIRSGNMDAARSRAVSIVRRRFRTARHTGMPLETRGCLAIPSRQGLVLWSSTQIPHIVRSLLAEVVGWPEKQVEVRVPDVGGGFGVKGHVYLEDVLTSILALRVGRPVKWVEDRLEHFVGSIHAREHIYDLELFVGSEGRVEALSGQVTIDAGAYPIYPQTGALEAEMTARILPGPYAITTLDISSTSVATNKTPIGTYRGVARPTAAFALERLVDEAARETGIDPAEFRLRNAVRDFPFKTGTGLEYDRVSVVASIERAREQIAYDSIRSDRSASSRTSVFGVGLACFVEQTAHIPPWADARHGIVGAADQIVLEARIDGVVEARLGLCSAGQGQETFIADVVADRLGLDPAQVQVTLGSTRSSEFSMGTLASRSAVVGATLAATAADRLGRELRERAAALLDVPADLLVLTVGEVRASREAAITIAELVDRLGVPNDEGGKVIAASASYEGPRDGTFSNACHAAVVEVDTLTGEVDIARYVVVHDCGRVVNPQLVEGQVVGGIAQGLGGALFEELIYDESGQLITGQFMDYALPSAQEVPTVEMHHLSTPGRAPLGLKGTGESGAIGPMAAIANAVADAIGDSRAARICTLPLTPARVWEILHTDHGEGEID